MFEDPQIILGSNLIHYFGVLLSKSFSLFIFPQRVSTKKHLYRLLEASALPNKKFFFNPHPPCLIRLAKDFYFTKWIPYFFFLLVY